jgi:acetyl-CoA carboxylase beta subunit
MGSAYVEPIYMCPECREIYLGSLVTQFECCPTCGCHNKLVITRKYAKTTDDSPQNVWYKEYIPGRDGRG